MKYIRLIAFAIGMALARNRERVQAHLDGVSSLLQDFSTFPTVFETVVNTEVNRAVSLESAAFSPDKLCEIEGYLDEIEEAIQKKRREQLRLQLCCKNHPSLGESSEQLREIGSSFIALQGKYSKREKVLGAFREKLEKRFAGGKDCCRGILFALGGVALFAALAVFLIKKRRAARL